MAQTSIQTDFGDPFRPPHTTSQVDGACFLTTAKQENVEYNEKPSERVPREYIYNTDKHREGLLVILNHVKFDGNTRIAINDSSEIITETKKTWTALQFHVNQYNDLFKSEIRSTIEKVSSTIHNYACLVCIVNTHGREDELKARDGWYNADQLWNPFLKEKSTWHGKPKIFLIEAPRGTKVDKGITLKPFDLVDAVVAPSEKTYRIPPHADFLFVYGTFYGHVSYDNDNGNPIFLKELCDVVRKHSRNTDFESMLTIVKHKVAHHVLNDTSREQFKQMPCIFSTLTKLLYFKSANDVVTSENETDSSISKRHRDQRPTLTIHGTLDGFDAKNLNLNINVS